MSKWTNGGENRTASILFGSQAVDATLYMGIYTAPSTEPVISATMNALTEPSTGGYARATLTRGSWTVTAGAASYGQQTFAAAGAAWGNCYGYFVTTTSSGTAGILMAVEQFADGPYNIGDGDSIRVTPTITVV